VKGSTGKDDIFLFGEIIRKVGGEDPKPTFQYAEYSLNSVSKTRMAQIGRFLFVLRP
jgi:hypothetical protein